VSVSHLPTPHSFGGSVRQADGSERTQCNAVLQTRSQTDDRSGSGRAHHRSVRSRPRMYARALARLTLHPPSQAHLPWPASRVNTIPLPQSNHPSTIALLKHGLIAATDLLFAYSATKFAIRGMTQSAGMCSQDFLFF
jgi:hypothetical protein